MSSPAGTDLILPEEDRTQLHKAYWPTMPICVDARLPEPYLVVRIAGGVGYWNGRAWYTLTQEPWPGREVTGWAVRYWLSLQIAWPAADR